MRRRPNLPKPLGAGAGAAGRGSPRGPSQPARGALRAVTPAALAIRTTLSAPLARMRAHRRARRLAGVNARQLRGHCVLHLQRGSAPCEPSPSPAVLSNASNQPQLEEQRQRTRGASDTHGLPSPACGAPAPAAGRPGRASRQKAGGPPRCRHTYPNARAGAAGRTCGVSSRPDARTCAAMCAGR